MNRRPVSRILLFLTAAYALLLLGSPRAAADGFAQGLSLCARSVLPALFPFFVVSNLLISAPESALLAAPLRPLVRAAGLRDSAAPILLLSWLGGYAVCAQLTGGAVRSGRLAPGDAQRLLILGCCSGPGFVVGCVGGLMLGSVRLGVLLYGLQLAANLLAAALLHFCLSLRRAGRVPPAPAQGCQPDGAAARGAVASLPAAIRAAVDSSLTVCGSVLFFRVTGAMLENFLPLTGVPRALLLAALEVTAGCDAFAGLGGAAALRGCCLCLSLLGLSVFSQVRQLAGNGVPLGLFALSRCLHLVLLQALAGLCAPALPGDAAVFSSLQDRLIVTSRLAPDTAFVLFCFFAAALYKTGQKIYNMHQGRSPFKPHDGRDSTGR